MQQIYIFSGLGVDHRVFNNINFGNLQIQHIEWIAPLENETIENYALRISTKITAKNPILIGLSFGGIVAIEIAKIKKVYKVIMIASAKNKYELPYFYRLIGKLKINKLIPFSLLKKQNFLTNWFFGIELFHEKKLLKNILKETDVSFLKWAVNEILNWKNLEIPKNIFQIHGSSDRIIPIRNINTEYVIKNGGHFMTINKSKEIETLILELCSK